MISAPTKTPRKPHHTSRWGHFPFSEEWELCIQCISIYRRALRCRNSTLSTSGSLTTTFQRCATALPISASPFPNSKRQFGADKPFFLALTIQATITDRVMQSIIVMQNDFSQPLHIYSSLFLLVPIFNILINHGSIFYSGKNEL